MWFSGQELQWTVDKVHEVQRIRKGQRATADVPCFVLHYPFSLSALPSSVGIVGHHVSCTEHATKASTVACSKCSEEVNREFSPFPLRSILAAGVTAIVAMHMSCEMRHLRTSKPATKHVFSLALSLKGTAAEGLAPMIFQPVTEHLKD